jgi:hypothetical protein
MLDFPAKFPTPLFSISLLLVSLFIMVLALRIRIPKPIALWIIFVSFINLVSSAYFSLFPSLFPYDIKHFSELYVMTEINIWLLIPIISGMALLPLPSRMYSKFAVIVFTLIYSVIFGIIRYAVFLNILAKFSFLFMSVLFFAFGPLMDFVYIVGIYSFYLSNLSKKARFDLQIWKWSY